MTCEQFMSFFVPYKSYQEWSTAEHAAVIIHWGQCPSCARRVKAIAGTKPRSERHEQLVRDFTETANKRICNDPEALQMFTDAYAKEK